ncbi:cytochrome c1 [Afipia birgiae]|jgi:ubiquinol-cytochrome c reductase cytochrome b/c1 subunit|uniref:cytochrome c1 n=1 Tax=Afipia birgiae TaxID=151414 RepID=UPI00031F88A7|nr:cytochrome c1 [Afipia birgiae]MBX9819422.1 cytochrome b N-terminal domain-containing protein [Afipia birgiae]
MSGPSNYNPQNPALKWVERRLPIGGLIHSSFVAYPTPRNLNYWWTFGAILSMMLGVQIITGIILAMHYTPHVDFAFKSVELIVRDVNYGWLLRYLHSNGASMFFIAVYIHMFRGLYYGSYKEPREVLWILGVIIYLLMMATGFMGYVLPWGQMSFWGATVITNLFSAIPYFGESIVTLLWGGYSVGNPTLNRFFSLHYLLPFVIAGVVVLHVWALHVAGQNNPAGVEPKTEKDTVPFTPYATLKDAFGMTCFLLFFAWFLFYIPNYLGDPDNYIPANPAVTPAHIVPEWYYLPFYAILRSIPNKLAGVIAMFSAIIVLAFLPWLDSAKTRSSKYRPLAKQFFWIFVAICLGLGWLGAKPAEGIYVIAGRVLTFAYFAYFLIVLPILSRIEKARPLPNSIAEDVLRKTGKTPVSAMIALAVGGMLMLGVADNARAAEGAPTPPSLKWSFAGPLGKFDQGQLQRGLKVYKEVCAACHGLSFVAFRNLADPGGPGYSPAQAAAFASEYKVKDGPDDKGEMFERNGRPADYFPSPYPNEQAARASNGGAYPPDLSLIAKARGYERGFPQFVFDAFTQFQEKGPNYLDALLQGYEDKAPAGFALPEGSYYNKFFPGHAIKMPKPLSDGQVTYDDGSPATVQQYAKDVSAFLMWTAEPHLEARKRLGLQVMIFLIVLSGLLYFTKKKVWADAH